tara:strand:+ start:42 stop:674 length:633 start_codon:yes stop_codon:yes gene_type:complete
MRGYDVYSMIVKLISPTSQPLKEVENVDTSELASKLGGVTIFRKGRTDVITNGKVTLEYHEDGSPRRCGGQGDITAGSIGTFLAWNHIREEKNKKKQEEVKNKPPREKGESPNETSTKKGGDDNSLEKEEEEETMPTPGPLLACYAGAVLTKTAGLRAFEQSKRATTTSDIISHLGEVFEELFPAQDNMFDEVVNEFGEMIEDIIDVQGE